MKIPKWLKDLPVSPPPEDRWQVSLRPLSVTILEGENGPWHPSLLLIVESGKGAVLGHRLLEADPDPDLVIDLMLATMSEPAMGSSRRPRKIETDSDSLIPPLKELATQVGMVFEKRADLPELGYAIDSFEEFVGRGPQLYLEGDDADPEVVRNFFQAAAHFYRAKCWTRIADSEPLTIVYPEEGSSRARYAVVMGNSRIVLGLALYDDPEDLEDLYESETDTDTSEMSCTSVVYVEKKELSPEAKEEIRENGWDVASYKAVPMAIRTDALGPARMPSMKQLRDLEIALLAIPTFLNYLPRRARSRKPVPPVPFLMEFDGAGIPMQIGYGIFIDESQGLISDPERLDADAD